MATTRNFFFFPGTTFSRLTQGELNSCGWCFFQAYVTFTITHKNDEFTSIDWLDLIDVESRWGIDQLFSLSLNGLMDKISTNIQTTILYLCKTIWKFKTVYYKIGATILHEDIFIISLLKIFPDINRLKTRVWREKHCNVLIIASFSYTKSVIHHTFE